jgi:hypothetical protein
MFKSLFGAKHAAAPAAKLPQINAFVEVVVGGRPMRSVAVESVDARGITTREVLGRAGESAVLVYTTPDGRVRAHTRIASVGSASTDFELPKSIEPVGAGDQKRQSVRMDAVVPAQWRHATRGAGMGRFLRGSVRDISRGGCALIIDRELKLGTQVEVRLTLRTDLPVLTLLAQVTRHELIRTSGRHSHGMRWSGLRPEEDQEIVTFINQRQADLRNRGLA